MIYGRAVDAQYVHIQNTAHNQFKKKKIIKNSSFLNPLHSSFFSLSLF